MRQQASLRTDNASVNELSLINRSGKKLMLLAGEVIVGGKQDRIVQDDLIVPPVSVPVSLSVFCVEHGRWSQRASEGGGGGGASAAAAPVIAPTGAEGGELLQPGGAHRPGGRRRRTRSLRARVEGWADKPGSAQERHDT